MFTTPLLLETGRLGDGLWVPPYQLYMGKKMKIASTLKHKLILVRNGVSLDFGGTVTASIAALDRDSTIP